MESERSLGQVRIQFRYTRREYVRGVRFYLRKSNILGWIQLGALVLALVVVVALFAIVGRTLLNTFVAVLLVLVALCEVFYYIFQPGRLFDRSPLLSGSVGFVFTVEDIGRHNETAAAILAWQVKRFWRCAQFYYLLEENGGYTMLPRRAFVAAQAEKSFERMVFEANPDIVFRNFD